MNILDMVRGMLFGYGLKTIQIAATLLVVPYLLSMLGIDRYGRIFAIVSAVGLLSLVSDGLKLSFSRSISRAIPRGPDATGRHLGAGLKAMLLVAIVFVAGATYFARPMLDLLGVPWAPEYGNSVLLAAGIVALENGFFAFHAYLTARGRLDFLNAMAGVEVIARNAGFVLYFMSHPARADAYFAIWFASSAIRVAATAAYAIWNHPADFRAVLEGRMGEAWSAVTYSLPLTLDSLQHYIFQRFSIPLVNRFIGPAEAGLLALGINTISGNLAQVLFTVARPLLVPVAARLDLDRMAASKKTLLLRVDAIFAVCVAVTMVPLIALMPTIIGFWLGADYEQLVLPAQILVAGTTIAVSFNIRRSMLIGQGKGVAIVKVSICLLPFALAAFGWSLIVAKNWVYVALVIASFSAVSTVCAVGLVFERTLLVPAARIERGTLRRTLAWSIAIASAIYVSHFAPTTLTPSLVLPAFGALAIVGILTHLLVISAEHFLSTLRRLKGGARLSLFADETESKQASAPGTGSARP